MAIVLNREPSTGEKFTSSLSDALNQLTNIKLQDMQQKKMLQQQQAQRATYADALKQMGLSPELAQFDPTVAREIIKQQYMQPLYQNEAQGLQAILSQLGGAQPAQAPGGQEIAPQQAPPVDLAKIGPMRPGKGLELAKFAQQVSDSERGRKIQQEGLDIKKQQRIDTKFKPFFEQIERDYDTAQKSQLANQEQRDLIKTGKLPDPLWVSGLDTLAKGVWGIGIDLRSLLGPEAEAYEKITAGQIKDAISNSGVRLTDQKVKMLLRAFPALSNTDRGKEMILDIIDLQNQLTNSKKNISDQLLEQNNDEIPKNYKRELDKRYAIEGQRIEKEYNKRIKEAHKYAQTLGPNASKDFQNKVAPQYNSWNDVELVEGDIFRDDSTGQTKIVLNGRLVPYKG